MLLWINRILVVFVIAMFVIACTVFYAVNYEYVLPEVHVHYYQLLPVNLYEETPQTKNEIVELVNNEFGFQYVLYYTNFNDLFINGRATLFFNIIEIDEDLAGEQFAIVLTHELVHLKYRTTDERFTNFHTFLTLYESQSPYLNYCSIILANMVFSHSFYPTAYDCCYYIADYLDLS